MSEIKRTGPDITVNLFLGGMEGPEGSHSHASFWHRRKIVMIAHVQEDSLPIYASSEAECVELGEMLGRTLFSYMSKDESIPKGWS